MSDDTRECGLNGSTRRGIIPISLGVSYSRICLSCTPTSCRKLASARRKRSWQLPHAWHLHARIWLDGRAFEVGEISVILLAVISLLHPGRSGGDRPALMQTLCLDDFHYCHRAGKSAPLPPIACPSSFEAGSR